MSPGSWQKLSKLEKLRSLSLEATNLTDKTAYPVLNLRALESLTLNETDISDSTVARLAQMPKLLHVELIDCRNTSRQGLKPLIERGIQFSSEHELKPTEASMMDDMIAEELEGHRIDCLPVRLVLFISRLSTTH